MDLKNKQSLSANLSQQQIMGSSQIQALEILQTPVLELQSMIDAELEINPVLETEGQPDEMVQSDQNESDDFINKILELDEESRYIYTGTKSSYSQEDEDKRAHYLDSVVAQKTLQEKLSEQLRFFTLSKGMQECCDCVIAGLDHDAYLTAHSADLAMAADKPVEMIDAAIKMIQKLEPVGVAARSLQERLKLQLQRKGLEGTILYTAVDKYLDDIAKKRHPKVAQRLKLSMEDFKELVLEKIQALNPKIVNEEVSPHEYISEEVTAVEKDGKLTIKLNNEHLPNLHISKQYRDILKDADSSEETKKYIKDKVLSAASLITMVLQRQQTIHKVVDVIIKEQANFFLKGKEYLIPMTMEHVAKQLDVHETTISRTVHNKYIRCKHGLYPLREMFSHSFIQNKVDKSNPNDKKTKSGEDDVTQMQIKSAMKDVIDNEDKRKPLSDIKIAEALDNKGLKVARRTIAKYRESLNILTSNLRREY